MNPRLRFALRLVVGGVLLAIVIANADRGELSVPWGPRLIVGLAGVVAINLIALGISSRRWRLILGPDAPPAMFLWRLYLIGSFFSLFLPTSVGGDAVRAAAAAKARGGAGVAVAGVFFDRLFGVFPLFGYLVLGGVLAPAVLDPAAKGLRWQLHPVVILVGVALSIFATWMAWRALSRRDLMPKAVREGGEVVERLFGSPPLVAAALGLGVVVQGLYIFAWGVLGSSLNLPLDWTVYVACVPLVSIASMLPVSISGLGLREGAWVLLLRPLGVSSGQAIVYGLSFFLCTVFVGVVGGILFITLGTGLNEVSRRPVASRR